MGDERDSGPGAESATDEAEGEAPSTTGRAEKTTSAGRSETVQRERTVRPRSREM